MSSDMLTQPSFTAFVYWIQQGIKTHLINTKIYLVIVFPFGSVVLWSGLSSWFVRFLWMPTSCGWFVHFSDFRPHIIPICYVIIDSTMGLSCDILVDLCDLSYLCIYSNFGTKNCWICVILRCDLFDLCNFVLFYAHLTRYCENRVDFWYLWVICEFIMILGLISALMMLVCLWSFMKMWWKFLISNGCHKLQVWFIDNEHIHANFHTLSCHWGWVRFGDDVGK